MKILLYTEGLKTIGKSGLGKAIEIANNYDCCYASFIRCNYLFTC